MPRSRLARAAGLALTLVLVAAAPARADLAPWSQERVTQLAVQLVKATDDLYDTFFKQPKPATTVKTAREYDRLKRDIRNVRNAARGLAGDLKRGEGRDKTLANYQSLVSDVNWADERASHVFTTQDVQQRASAARALLVQLAPYYDPDAPKAAP